MGRPCLETLFESIRKSTLTISYEIVLVVPKSVSLPTKLLNEYKPRLVLEERPTGCVAAFNSGMRAARGKYIAHINDDCQVCPGWLDEMLSLVGDRDVLGAFYIQEPDTDGFIVNSLWGKLYANFGLAKKSLFEELGYWDESYFQYGGDPDFALKVWHAGYQVVATPKAKIIHHCIVDEHRKEHLREDAYNQLVRKWKGIYC